MKPTKRAPTILVCCLFLLCLVVASFPFSVPAQRGLTVGGKKITNKQGEEVLLYKESHALVIGVSTYTNGWPNLPGVRQDVQEVKAALEAQGFHVVVEMDVDRNAMRQAFDNFINEYGLESDNRLVFYFAGHGYTSKLKYGGEMGYIIPADAPLREQDERGFFAKAMDMQMIEVYAKRIQAKHALFLFDSCFSGSLFRVARAAPEYITYKTANPVRQFITSGSANEMVPDESVFRRQFVAALAGEGDKNGDGYVTASELGLFLENTVINYTRGTQHPQYGRIRDPYLDKGDFVFQLSQKPPPTPTTSIARMPTPTPLSFEDLETLANMEEAFMQASAYEQRSISAKLKIAYWQRFLNGFESDISSSTRDEELRTTARERITFWKESAIPTPTPIPPLPTPTPSEADRNQQNIAQILQTADAYFARQWYTTPEDTNAFDLYREVLTFDPGNQHALQQIDRIAQMYKFWAEQAETQGKTAKAAQNYRKYLKVVPDDQVILDKIDALENPVPTPTPTLKLLPTATPTLIPAVTPTPIPELGGTWTDPVTGMEFVWIPDGCFQMGCVSGSSECDSDEKPVHEVCVDGFWIGKYEVTQAQWQKIMGNNPSEFKGKDRPVETVSWNDTQEFIKKLNSLSATHPTPLPGGEFRLPTEAEWEYAARAGTQTAYYFGNDSSRSGEYAWFVENSGNRTHPVGQLKSNAWGLYDMYGNVWEWCEDIYSRDAYKHHQRQNPVNTSGGSYRVIRGGSWYFHPQGVRSAYRFRYAPSVRDVSLGFRLVRNN